MKILITGSERGLGKRIYENLCHDYKISEFDFTLLHEYDVLINNCIRKYDQLDLLQTVFDSWKDREKTIINIGSRSKYSNISKGFTYSAKKSALSHMASNMRFLSDKTCRIMDLNPGMLNSENIPSLSYQEVIDALRWMLKVPKHIEVGELNFWYNMPYDKISKMKDELKNDE